MKSILAGTEKLPISIDSLYKDMEATFKHLEAESKDLLDLVASVEAMSTDETAKFIRQQGISVDLFFELYIKMICLTTHLSLISVDLRAMHRGYESIHKGLRYLSSGSEDLPVLINSVCERMEDVIVAAEAISTAEKITRDDKEIICAKLEILSLTIDLLSKKLYAVTLNIRNMKASIKLIHESMSLVSECMPRAFENIKCAYESVKYFVSRPVAMLIRN